MYSLKLFYDTEYAMLGLLIRFLFFTPAIGIHVPLFALVACRPEEWTKLWIIKNLVILYLISFTAIAAMMFVVAKIPASRKLIDHYLGEDFVGYCPTCKHKRDPMN